MSTDRKICAVVPVKEGGKAKQRLARVLNREQRRQLAQTMLEDVLSALAATPELASILVVTADEAAAEIAARCRAEISEQAACDGHTAAVAAAARRLDERGLDMITLPADIPLVQPGDIRHLLRAHGAAMEHSERGFTIVPSRDERGSNAILASPAGAVPLQFGDDSFFPHLAAAKACGIEPVVARLRNVALDIDTPEDMGLLLALPARTRTQALLAQWRSGLTAPCTAARRKARRSSE
jgi:2-phospho-L-lactate/phosphoenolpyruvate guanylyltransferase